MILSALGCGAFGDAQSTNSPIVRDIYKTLLEDPNLPFRRFFKRVDFAIFPRPGFGPDNYTIWRDAPITQINRRQITSLDQNSGAEKFREYYGHDL